MKKPSLRVLRYRHHPKYKFVLDLRGFGQGRKFFKTRAEAEAERLRQKTTLERHGREAIGLSQRDLSDFITGKKKLAQYGKTVNDAFAFYLDHLDRVLRCKTTVAELAQEVIDKAQRWSGPAILGKPEALPVQVCPRFRKTSHRSRQSRGAGQLAAGAAVFT